MKQFILGFLGTLVLLMVAVFGYLRLGAAEVRADVPAPAWQRRLTQFAVHAAVRRSAPKVRSSLPHTDRELIAGGKLYLDGCEGCHGWPGGPRRKRVLFSLPPELAYVGTQYSEPERFWIIKHGIRRTGMSAWGTTYTDEQLWTLAAFVGRMQGLPPSVLDAIQPKKP
ncbi:MAG TPA: cytochrome c [Thermoanaerobaculia bacterium]